MKQTGILALELAGLSYAVCFPVYAPAGVTGPAYAVGVGLVAVCYGKTSAFLMNGIISHIINNTPDYSESPFPPNVITDFFTGREKETLMNAVGTFGVKTGLFLGTLIGFKDATEFADRLIKEKFGTKSEKYSKTFTCTSRDITDTSAPLPPKSIHYNDAPAALKM